MHASCNCSDIWSDCSIAKQFRFRGFGVLLRPVHAEGNGTGMLYLGRALGRIQEWFIPTACSMASSSLKAGVTEEIHQGEGTYTTVFIYHTLLFKRILHALPSYHAQHSRHNMCQVQESSQHTQHVSTNWLNKTRSSELHHQRIISIR